MNGASLGLAPVIPTNIRPRACIVKLIMTIIYGFRKKLECLYLNTRLGWKGLPGTNTLAYYGNRKSTPKKFYDTGPWPERPGRDKHSSLL